jgi:hypothetical protein
MVKRLAELYQPGDQVELKLADGEWRLGQVVRHDPPGIWVATSGPCLWFVTNSRRIRAAKEGKRGAT